MQQRIRITVLGLILALTVNSGCGTAGKNTAVGTGIGAAAGAAVGAIIGHQSGNRGKGAALGAAIGGVIGGTAGYRMDKQAKELEKIAETKRTDQGLITKMKSDILFDTGKADLKPAAVSNLSKMSAILKKYPENVITVRGYTDSTGSMELNKKLSEQRATAVREQILKGGVPADTVSVVGMGPENPIAENTTPEGRSKNRRVEIEIVVDESKVPEETKK